MGPAVAERTPRSPHYRDPPGKHLSHTHRQHHRGLIPSPSHHAATCRDCHFQTQLLVGIQAQP